MTTTETRPESKLTQPGDTLGHYCAAHIYDHQCASDFSACRAFCGFEFTEPGFDDLPECAVCAEMLATRGDPYCECPACVALDEEYA